VRQTPASATANGTTIIQANTSLFDLDLRALWQSRELLYFLAWRDVKVRYKQTVLGAAWAIINPVLTMLIFTVVFGRFARIPSDGLPYSVFALVALVPWTFFAQAAGRSATSLVANVGLITKIYFPRLLIPVASMALPAVDFAFSMLAVVGLMIWYGTVPSWAVLALPLFFLLAVLVALTVGLLLSPIHGKYRDVGQAVPLVIQLWMYASPVVYPVSLVPEAWRQLYSLNPMVGVIEGFRWSLLNTSAPDFRAILINAALALCLLVGAIVRFNRTIRTFADVV
jgi:lipopolysaccharide transport system permease protein